MRLNNPRDLEDLRKQIARKRDPTKPCITICSGTGCCACGCEVVTETFRNEIKKQGLEKKINIRTTGCHGFCERGPLIVIHPEGIFYQRIKTEDVEENSAKI